MEESRIVFDDGTGKAFNIELKKNDFKDAGDVSFIAKDKCTQGGNPCVLIGFTIDVGGILKNVSTVTTAKLFITAAKAIEAKYPDLFK